MKGEPPPRAVRTALVLLPRVGRGWLAAFAGLTLWQGLSGVLYTVATGALLSSVPPAVGLGLDSPEGRRLLRDFALVGGIFLAGRLLVPLAGLVGSTVGRRYHRMVLSLVIDAGCRPSTVVHLEDPAVADRLALARGGDSRQSSASFTSAVARVSSAYIACAASAAVLLRFAWWAPLVVLAGMAGEWAWFRGELRSIIDGAAWAAPEIRRAGYFRDLALTAAPAKEARVFGLGAWSLDRCRTTWLAAMEPVWRRRRRLGSRAGAAAAVLVATQAVVAVAVVLAGVDGRISVGDVAVYLASAAGMAQLVWVPEAEWQLRASSTAVAYAVGLHDEFARPPAVGGRPAAGLPVTGIAFDGVCFRYPGADRDVLEGLDLEIPAGRSLAIVGLNGAGKTTLVKLLAGLYRPTAGSLTVDGVDVGELDLAAWRRRLAVIFQDFVHYELSVTDNVGFGAPSLLGDPAGLGRAARRAGAADLIAGLPGGWETVLSRRFAGGVELSGGEWQRLALARCLAAVEAGASVLVLDEPTASLDVRGEAEVFDRFLELTAGLTTVVISHRFSTVRQADRIVVLEGGRVVEQGAHAGLVADGGRYATMFDRQAARLGMAGDVPA